MNLSNISFSNLKFYSRIKILSSGSIFTTTGYNKSPKRNNYCALLSDEKFFFIESFICLQTTPTDSRIFLIGTVLGVESEKPYLPKPINDIRFSKIPGMMTKLVGKGEREAYDALDIVAKCVIASHHELTESYVVTSLPNNFETD